jgi:hypothetical protein
MKASDSTVVARRLDDGGRGENGAGREALHRLLPQLQIKRIKTIVISHINHVVAASRRGEQT